jgi:hypothetical protein
LNTVRSIIHDHGNLIDRHQLMARSAIFGAYRDQLQLGVKMKIRAWFDLRLFDFILFYDKVKRWSMTQFYSLLIKFGRIDKEIAKEIQNSFKNNGEPFAMNTE